MSVAEFVSTLASTIAGRRQAAVLTYRQMLDALADGKKPPKPEIAEKILADAGKTPADVETEVATILRRRELAAVMAKASATQPERDDIAAAVARVQKVFDAALQVYNQAMAELGQRQRVVDQIDAAARHAEAKLRSTYAGPLDQEIADLMQRRGALGAQKQALERRKKEAALEVEEMTRHQREETRRDPGAAAAKMDGIAASFDPKIRELEEAAAAIDVRVEAIQKEMLLPH
jgi:hypothetical protein